MRSIIGDTRGQMMGPPRGTIPMFILGAVGWVIFTTYVEAHGGVDLHAPRQHPLLYAVREAPGGVAAAVVGVGCLVAVLHYASNVHRWGEEG